MTSSWSSAESRQVCSTRKLTPRANRSKLNGSKWTIESETRDTTNTIKAPHNAVAVIVDISTPGGKFVIGKAASDLPGVQAVDEVAAVNAEQLMIWAWEPEWEFYALGTIQLRWLIK